MTMLDPLKVEPFLGRMLIKIEVENVKERLDRQLQAETGVSSEFLSKFEVVRGESRIDHDTGQKTFEMLQTRTPRNRGKIVKMSTDCFGDAFRLKYGDDRETPNVGDIVIFVANKSYQVDAENQYHIIDDNEVVGWFKDNKVEEITNE